jgi:hypothetical protein
MKSMGSGLLKPFLSGGSVLKSLFSGPEILKSLSPAAGAEAGGGAGAAGGSMFSKLGNAGSSIAKGFGSLTKGIADVIKTVLVSLADGIKAFGNTQVLKGAVALGIVAGDLYIAGKAFQEFGKVNWESMGKAGVALIAIGGAAAIAGRDAAMIALGGGALGIAIGAIGLGMMAAGAGLEKFNDISWEAMGKAGVAIVGLGLAAAAAGLVAPLIALGGVALGIAIGAIGAGIAGAAFLLGDSLPILAAGMQKFAELDGESLKQAGEGMKGIAVGLLAMTGGSLANALGSLASGILNFFTGNDPIEQLKRFGELGVPLGIASIAMTKFAKGYKSAISAINTVKLNTSMLKGLDSLKDFFADNSAFTSMGEVFSVLLDIDTPIEQLMKLGEIAKPLTEAGVAIRKFADMYKDAISKINSIKFDTSVVTGLDTLTKFFAGDGLFASIGKAFDALLGIETPLDQLKSLGEIAEPLNNAGDAISKFALAYPKGITAINTNILSADAISSLDKLKSMFEGDSVGNWFAGDNDLITKLVSLGDSTASLPAFSSRITGFADAYTYLVQAFNEPISTEALANLVGLTDLINQQAALNSPGLLGSIFGSTSAETIAPAAPNAAIEAAKAKVAATPVDKKHNDMMEILTKINDNMNSLLTVEDRQTRVMNDGFSRISGVVH